jgi:hypothetical protein
MNANIKRFLAVLALVVTTQSAHAGSATWNLNPTSNDWNTAENWTPATIPSSETDVATFAASPRAAVQPRPAPALLAAKEQ